MFKPNGPDKSTQALVVSLVFSSLREPATFNRAFSDQIKSYAYLEAEHTFRVRSKTRTNHPTITVPADMGPDNSAQRLSHARCQRAQKCANYAALKQAMPIKCMGNAGLPETRTWQVETRHRDAGLSAGILYHSRTRKPATPICARQ